MSTTKIVYGEGVYGDVFGDARGGGLVARGLDEYVRAAVRVVNDLHYRERVVQTLKDARDRVFEVDRTVREWEAFLERAVRECDNSGD